MIKLFSRDFKDVEALWVLDFLGNEDLPEWADQMLKHGIESDALIELAISPVHEFERNRANFLEILGIKKEHEISKSAALRRLGRLLSQRIVDGQIAPLEAANLIWSATVRRPVANFHDLDPFIYAASEAANRPDESQFFENAIVHEAARFFDSFKDV